MNASGASAERAAASKHGPFCDIVVIGASAGGVAALKTLVSAFPADLPASLFVVLHRGNSPSALASLLSEWGLLTAVDATDGHAHRATHDLHGAARSHLLIEEGAVRVVRGPKENRHRPAIDPLFRSAAWAYGPMDKLGKVTPFTCPACHGALWEVDDEHVLRYRCHTRHGFTAGALDIEQDEAIEGVLFSAARALEESAAIARNIAARARGREQNTVAARFEEKAKRAEQNAGSIRNLLADKRKTANV